MEDLLILVTQYGPYVACAVIVAGLVQALKKAFGKFFTKTVLGMRILPFIPMVLGVLAGLFLPLEDIQAKLLVGGALGTVSSLIYKAVTRTFAKKVKLLQKMGQGE